MRLHSYIVARDYGFAPNPFYGLCTLATCKPRIRKSCAIGDWVMGTGSQEESRPGHLVYIMQISEAMSFDEYWRDPRFLRKRPDLRGSLKQAFGDNIYCRPDPEADWRQLPSHHSLQDGRANPSNIWRDTSVNRVLIADQFVYWGADAPKIPDEFRTPEDICMRGQGNMWNFSKRIVKSFLDWVHSSTLTWGRLGDPYKWDTERLVSA